MKGIILILCSLLLFPSCEPFKDKFTTVEGQITDENTGVPIEGITTSICSDTKFVPGSPCGNVISTESDKDGYYFLEYDLSEKGESYYLVTAANDQYFSSGEIEVQVGEKNIANIQLKPR